MKESRWTKKTIQVIGTVMSVVSCITHVSLADVQTVYVPDDGKMILFWIGIALVSLPGIILLLPKSDVNNSSKNK